MKVGQAFLFLLLLISQINEAIASPETPYQDGVLISFSTVTDGANCDSSTRPTIGQPGSSTTSSSCYDTETTYYTIRVGPNSYVIRSGNTSKQAAKKAFLVIGTFGYGALFLKKGVLANQLPGAHFLIMSEGSGFNIKVGKRNSHYDVVEAK